MAGGSDTAREAANVIWVEAAKALGWEWSPAYGGFIRSDYHPDGVGHEFSSYPSDVSAEEACDIDGVATLDDAQRIIAAQVPA